MALFDTNILQVCSECPEALQVPVIFQDNSFLAPLFYKAPGAYTMSATWVHLNEKFTVKLPLIVSNESCLPSRTKFLDPKLTSMRATQTIRTTERYIAIASTEWSGCSLQQRPAYSWSIDSVEMERSTHLSALPIFPISPRSLHPGEHVIVLSIHQAARRQQTRSTGIPIAWGRLRVTSAPLVIQMLPTPQTYIAVPQNQEMLCLNPLRFSYDPNVPRGSLRANVSARLFRSIQN